MTTLPLYGGALKRDLIQQAYGECGQSSNEFELDPEDYAAANRIMDRMMRFLKGRGVDLGYNYPDVGAVGNPMDESGIPDDAQEAVVAGLAMRLAPTIGKALAAETKAVLAASWSALFASYVTTPQMALGRNTIRGAGNRRYGWRSPFFCTVPSPDEIPQ